MKKKREIKIHYNPQKKEGTLLTNFELTFEELSIFKSFNSPFVLNIDKRESVVIQENYPHQYYYRVDSGFEGIPHHWINSLITYFYTPPDYVDITLELTM